MMGKRVLQRQVGKKTIKGKIVFVQQLYDGGDMYITTSRRDGKSGGDEMICSVDLDVFEGDAVPRYQSLRVPFFVPGPTMSRGVRLFRRL
jgi:hypothetical protein